jgi:hypothetical protein
MPFASEITNQRVTTTIDASGHWGFDYPNALVIGDLMVVGVAWNTDTFGSDETILGPTAAVGDTTWEAISKATDSLGHTPWLDGVLYSKRYHATDTGHVTGWIDPPPSGGVVLAAVYRPVDGANLDTHKLLSAGRGSGPVSGTITTLSACSGIVVAVVAEMGSGGYTASHPGSLTNYTRSFTATGALLGGSGAVSLYFGLYDNTPAGSAGTLPFLLNDTIPPTANRDWVLLGSEWYYPYTAPPDPPPDPLPSGAVTQVYVEVARTATASARVTRQFIEVAYLDTTPPPAAPPTGSLIADPVPSPDLPDADLTVPDPPLGTHYLRYLPRWLSAYGTATAAPSAALLYRFFAPVLDGFRGFSGAATRVLDQAALAACPLNLPRLAWYLQTAFRSYETPAVSVRASGEIRSVRRAASLAEFESTTDPVFLLGDSGLMLFRNLAQRVVATGPVAATGSLRNQYEMPYEGQGIVGDADIEILNGGDRYVLHGGSTAIAAARARVQLSDALSGFLSFRYQSGTYQSVLQVSLSGSPWVTPSRTDLWNRLDELGLLASLDRRADEWNGTFATRVRARLLSPRGPAAEAAAFQIATDLSLVAILGWDGRQVLDLSASGYTVVRTVAVPGVPAVQSVEERLYSADGLTWTGSKSRWEPDWWVAVDGMRRSPATDGALARSGAGITFGTAPSGEVTARYRYRNYDLEYSASGTIARVLPVTGNLAPGAYQLLLSHRVRLNTPADPDFQAAELLDPAGLPNGRLRELRERLLSRSPLHLSRARWGQATWLDGMDETPPEQHLPVPFDRFADSGRS